MVRIISDSVNCIIPVVADSLVTQDIHVLSMALMQTGRKNKVVRAIITHVSDNDARSRDVQRHRQYVRDQLWGGAASLSTVLTCDGLVAAQCVWWKTYLEEHVYDPAAISAFMDADIFQHATKMVRCIVILALVMFYAYNMDSLISSSGE